MRLNEEQLMVIKATRKFMGLDGSPSYYICHAMGKVLSDMMYDGKLTEAQASTLKHQLSSGIIAGINHMVTFGGFMLLSCPVINNVYHHHIDSDYEELILQCRLAWLDWIIHTLSLIHI